jgi:hypothetical protein
MDGNTKFDMISFFGSINYIGSEELTSILKRLVKSGQVICCDGPKKNLDAFPLTISLETLSDGTDSQTFDASIKQTAHLLFSDSIFLQKAQSYFNTPDPFDAILDKLEEIHHASFISLRAKHYWKRYKFL